MSSLSRRTQPFGSSAGLQATPRSLRPGEALRSFVRLFWLDVKGSQGVFLLPVMVGLGLYASANLFEDGVVLWKMMNFAAVQSYTFIAPVTAGLAAWTASRDRRRNMEMAIASAPGNPFTRDLSILAATAGWGVLGYALVAACYASLALRRATWGGFDADLVATGALGVVLAAALGVLVGRHVPGRFAPLLAIGLAYGAVFLGDILRFFGFFVRLPELAPMDYAWRAGQDIYRQPPDDLVFEGILWLAGLIGVAVAVMAMARRRVIVGSVLGVSAVAMATVGASALMTSGPMFDELVPVAYEPACATEDTIEVCVHPAFEPLLDDTLRIVDGMAAPLVGLDGVRTQWTHGEGPNEMRPNAPDVQFRRLRGYNPAVDVANDLFPIVLTMEGENRPASQLAILYWLADRAGIGMPSGWSGGDVFAIGNPDEWAFGYPSEVPQVRHEDEYSIRFEIDEAALAASQAEIEAAADRFATLPEVDQRAWLEANWDALRAGKLTLDEWP